MRTIQSLPYPSYTSAQRDLLSVPVGFIINNTTVNSYQIYTGNGWADYMVGFRRINIADSDYTVTSTDNLILSVTSISQKRTITLPNASVVDQMIHVIDESGLVSADNRIKVVRQGFDTISGDTYNIQISPYTSVTYMSDGSGKWSAWGAHERLSTGCVILPSYTDLGTGSIIVGDNGLYNLYRNSLGLGNIKTYEIPSSATFTLIDQSINYVVVDYNSGTPIIRVITDVSLINEISVCPIFTIYRDGNTLHTLKWEALGLALINRIHKSIVKTQRYRLESGLIIGESPTRYITVTSGTVWVGANAISIENFHSASNAMYLYYHVSGAWTKTAITQYDNSHYDNGTNLIALNPNKYAVNYVYRSVDELSEAYVVLGGGNYTLIEAQGSLPPTNLPSIITSHCMLIGRIIVEQNANTAYQVDSIFSAAFALSSSLPHNDLSGLNIGDYLHLTSAEKNDFNSVIADAWRKSGNTVGNDNGWVGTLDNYDFAIKTNNTKRIHVTKDGNIGFGGIVPQKPLHSLGVARLEPIQNVIFDVTAGTITTTDVITLTCQSIPVPLDTAVLIESRINSRKTAGAGVGTVGDANSYIRIVKAKNVGGIVTIGTISSSYTSEDIAAFNATFVVSGTNVLVRVTGSASNTVIWQSISILTS